jgi:hypothetical protein
MCSNFVAEFGMQIWDTVCGPQRCALIATGSYARGFTWQCDKVSIPCVLRHYTDRVGRVGCRTEVVQVGGGCIYVYTKRKGLEHLPSKVARGLERNVYK